MTRFDALQEVGKVMHPILAAGQIEGGVAQGIGYALYEKVRLAKRPHDQQPDDQLHHAYQRRPPRHPRPLRRNPLCIHGPSGAKGIGELPMDGPAPAILNAIENALGIPFNQVPLMPEDIFEAMNALPAC